MIKYNQYNLKKLEQIFKESAIQVRYGKGAFQSGYCILESKNIVVVNKYFPIEGRVNCLIDLLTKVNINEEALSEASAKFLEQVREEMLVEKA